MAEIPQPGAGFRSPTESIDTTSPGGRMMMQIVSSFAEFERAMLVEPTRNGLDAARKQGRVGGRRTKLTPHQQQEILTVVRTEQNTSADAARVFNIHPATVSRLLQIFAVEVRGGRNRFEDRGSRAAQQPHVIYP